jgi:hypothetical protein
MRRAMKNAVNDGRGRHRIACGVILLLLLGWLLPGGGMAMEFFDERDSPEVRAQRAKLGEVCGFRMNRVTKPYSDDMLHTLVEALRKKDLRAWALILLSSVIQQYDIPRALSDQVLKPALNEIAAGPLEKENTGESLFTYSAQTALWRLKVRELLSSTERLEFLRGYLKEPKGSARRFYYEYAHSAMEYLVAMGTEEAKGVLQEKLRELEGQKNEKQMVTDLRFNIARITILLTLPPVDSEERVTALKTLLEAPYQPRFYAYPYNISKFERWLMDRLGEATHPTAIQVLREIWCSPLEPKVCSHPYDAFAQLHAQEILLRLKAIRPEEMPYLHYLQS